MQRANARNIFLFKRLAQTAFSKGNGAALNTAADQSKKLNDKNQNREHQEEEKKSPPKDQKKFAKDQIKENPPTKEEKPKKTPENMNPDEKRTAEESAKKTGERVWKVGAEYEG